MARKLIAWILALTMALMVYTAPALAASNAYVKASGYVRMRSGPGNYPVVQNVMAGTKLEVLSQSGSWYKVKLASGTQGYIYKDYIAKLSSGTSTSGTKLLGFTGTTCTVTASKTSLRKSGSGSAAILATIGKGTELAITGSSGYYYRVTLIHTGKKGYVLKAAVKMGIRGSMRGKAYIRTGASSSAKALRALPSGTSVVIYKVYASWSKVKYGSTEGYIYNSYLKP